MKEQNNIGGKAQGLLALSAIDGVRVPAFAVIPAGAGAQTQRDIISAFLKENPQATKLAVRSSALQEDSATASFAGAFKTMLNIEAREKNIFGAVQEIVQHGESKLTDVFNQAADASIGIVIQEMVDEPDAAGVCLSQGFTEQDAAYMLVNFKKGLGEGLVSGEVDGTQLRVLRMDAFKAETVEKFPFLPQLVDAVRKVESTFGNKPIDMEFAYKNGTLYMLQCRPLVTKNPVAPAVRQKAETAALGLAAPVAPGDVLCDMADINPRELLGYPVQPVNTALYRFMFADKTVEEARESLGYAPLHRGLLQEIAGKPYVSLRASAYSLRPEGISEATYDKIVDAYKDILVRHPDRQDKVEFAVYVTTSAQLPEFFSQYGDRFTAEEKSQITEAYRRVDQKLEGHINSFCAGYDAMMDSYRRKLAALSPDSPAEEIRTVLKEGTETFVRTARMAFYMKSKCDGLFGAEKVTGYLTAIDTPTERLRRSLLGYAMKLTGLDDLEKEYGHLRAGQMDIFAATYRDNLPRNLDLQAYAGMAESEVLRQLETLDDRHHGLMEKIAGLPAGQRKEIENLRTLFAARENVKHEFMKAYDLLAQKLKAEMAPLPLPAADLLMPDILTASTDAGCMETKSKAGTYFGAGRIEARPLVVTPQNLASITQEMVAGRILVMDHADPGYDFLLLFKPAGIITKIGGPASHIAIRVNEMGIPACIGCGIDISRVDESKNYVLDCTSKKHHRPQGNQKAGNAPRPS